MYNPSTQGQKREPDSSNLVFRWRLGDVSGPGLPGGLSAMPPTAMPGSPLNSPPRSDFLSFQFRLNDVSGKKLLLRIAGPAD